MELKYVLVTKKLVLTPSSNRTFMELKYQYGTYNHAWNESSNRTFMELKSGRKWQCLHFWLVLIVPLWN